MKHMAFENTLYLILLYKSKRHDADNDAEVNETGQWALPVNSHVWHFVFVHELVLLLLIIRNFNFEFL